MVLWGGRDCSRGCAAIIPVVWVLSMRTNCGHRDYPGQWETQWGAFLNFCEDTCSQGQGWHISLFLLFFVFWWPGWCLTQKRASINICWPKITWREKKKSLEKKRKQLKNRITKMQKELSGAQTTWAWPQEGEEIFFSKTQQDRRICVRIKGFQV